MKISKELVSGCISAQLKEELATLKRKKCSTRKLVSSLQDDIEKYSVEAGWKEDMKEMKILLAKANYFCEGAKKKRANIDDLETSCQKLEDEINSIWKVSSYTLTCSKRVRTRKF